MDCIEIEYCPEFPEQAFDYDAARATALTTLPGESCGAASACVMGEQPAEFVPEIDMKLFDPVIAAIRSGSGLVEALHATQEAYGYLPRLALEAIAEEMNVELSRVYGVASFYAQFRLRPVGKYVIDVCMGTACHVAGAPLVVEAFSNELEIPVGGTTPDGLFTLQTVNCVGACALAPVVRIGDEETLGRVGPNEARRLVRKLRKAGEGGGLMSADKITAALKAAADKNAYLADDAKAEIRICAGTACHASGRVALREAVDGVPAEARPHRQGEGRRDRLSRLLRAGPHHRPAAERPLLSQAQGHGHRRDHRDQRRRRRRGRAPALQASADRRAPGPREGHPLLRAAEAHSPQPQRQDRPVLAGRLSRPRRVFGAGQGAQGRRPRGRDRRDREEWPARPRWRGLPHRQEVALVRARTPATSTTSSATPTRATRARSWTARCSRATLIL